MSIKEPVEKVRGNRRVVRIEWGDCDPAGIVHFPRYFAMFDACTAAAFEAVGLPKPKLIEHFGIVGFPAVDVRGVFSAPCRFGEDVEIETIISRWGTSSFNVHHRLSKGAATAVEGFEVRVWTTRDPADASRLRGEPIPREVKERFRAGP